MKRLFLIITLAILPLYGHDAPQPKQQKRRYTIKDLESRKVVTPYDSNKFDQFLSVVATLGLFYWWPGGRINVRSGNANVSVTK